MSIDTVGGLIEALRAHRLLEPVQLTELTSLQGSFAEPRLLARELLQRGWLTAYQLNQLFQGHGAHLVLGQYLLLERIGEGGMGQVFKARHLRLKRLAALKFIRRECLTAPDALARFQREARAAARLTHPNIVTVYDADEVDGTHFFAMEYVEGTNLSKLVRDKGLPSVVQTCDWIRQVAHGLQHAQEQGLVHRDIKPANLIVTPQGQVKILDMGLARLNVALQESDVASEALTREGAVMGTPDYIAPEQAVSTHTVDIRADLYSLGCTFYFLLTGRPPFQGGTLAQKLLAHQNAEPPAVEDLNPDVPPGVTSIVRQLMAKRPEQRFQTPAALAVAVAAYCGDKIPVAVPVGASGGALEADSRIVSTIAPAALPLDGSATTVAGQTMPGVLPWRGWVERRWKPLALASGVVTLLLLALLLSGGKQGRRGGRPDDPGWPLDNLETSTFQELAEFDWPPKGLVLVLGSHRGRHWGPVRAVAWSPDGRLIASAGDDSLICVWKADTLQEYRLFRGHTGSVLSLAFSPDSARLLSGGHDKTIRLWDIAERREVLKLEGHGDPVTCLAYAQDGKRALSGASGGLDHAVRLWDLTGKGKEVHRLKGHTDSILYVAFSEDEKRAFTSGLDKSVRFWDLETGTVQRTITPVQAKDSPRINGIVAISKDGRHGYSNLPSSGTGYVWDLENGNQLGSAGGAETFDRCVLSPNGTRLATIRGDSKIRILDALTAKVVRVTSPQGGQADTVSTLAFSADGQHLVSGSLNGFVQLWDIERGEELRPRPGHTGGVHSVALSKDGRQVLTGGADKTLRLWNLASDPPGREERRFEGHQDTVRNVLFSASGTRALSSDGGTARLWDIRTARELHRVARTVDRTTGGVAFALGTDVPLTGIVTTNLSGLNMVIRLFDVAQDQEVHRFQAVSGQSIAVCSPNLTGKVIAASGHGNGELQLFGPGSEGPLVQSTDSAAPHSLAFTPDGAHLTWGLPDGSVRRWEVAAAASQPPTVFSGHTRQVTCVVQSTDGTLLAASAVDGRVIVWHTATRKVRQEWQFPGAVHGVAFDETGRYLATANANGTAFLLRLSSGAAK